MCKTWKFGEIVVFRGDFSGFRTNLIKLWWRMPKQSRLARPLRKNAKTESMCARSCDFGALGARSCDFGALSARSCDFRCARRALVRFSVRSARSCEFVFFGALGVRSCHFVFFCAFGACSCDFAFLPFLPFATFLHFSQFCLFGGHCFNFLPFAPLGLFSVFVSLFCR